MLYRIVVAFHGYEMEDNETGGAVTVYHPIHATIPIGGTYVRDEWDCGTPCATFSVWRMTMEDGEEITYCLHEYYATCIDGRERVAYNLCALTDKHLADKVPVDDMAWVSVHHSVNREPSDCSIEQAYYESLANLGE